jgi:DNA-binding CsgD family transcriptional regulator
MSATLDDPDDRHSSTPVAAHLSAAERPTPTPQPAPPLTDPGTVAVFTAFYKESAPRLVAFLRWQGVPLVDAADCAHHALTEAFPKMADPDSPVRLVSSGHLPPLGPPCRQHPGNPTDDPGSTGTPLITPTTDIDEVEHRHTLLRLLDLLPQRQRQVLAWIYDGASINETADALQITRDAVRSNLYKARTALRAHLYRTEGEK